MNKSRVEKLEKILKVDKGTTWEEFAAAMERFTWNARYKLLGTHEEISEADKKTIKSYNKAHGINTTEEPGQRQRLIDRILRLKKE